VSTAAHLHAAWLAKVPCLQDSSNCCPAKTAAILHQKHDLTLFGQHLVSSPAMSCIQNIHITTRLCAPADTGTEDIIPLPNVPGKILAKVIEYCKFHVEANKKVDDKPAKSEDDIKQWDTEFVKVDQATLFDLILVSSGWASEVLSPVLQASDGMWSL
jgi:hypothetical protein